jgi:protoporphyrinogen oxidase
MSKIAIIGSGISGLFAGLILKSYNVDVTIFERSTKIGGRIKVIDFDNEKVTAGAGIGRKDDKLLYSLCKKLNVTTTNYHASSQYTSPFINIKHIVSLLEKNLSSLQRDKENFKEFAIRVLGKEKYDKFIFSIGETDFEKADVIDTIYDYGFKNYTDKGFDAFSIKWIELLEAFERILHQEIKLGTNISKINFEKDGTFKINNIKFDKVIIATDIDNMKILLPKITIFRQIKGQPFVRLFVKLNEPIQGLVKNFVKTDKPFQKIIVINKDKCIYQISYCDNEVANKWKNTSNINKTVENGIMKIFKQKIKVLKHKLVYWKIGTHYFTPLYSNFKDRNDFLKEAQNPLQNIFCVGEAFSRNQGWCQGALESVLNILS